ncbi:hypothetical protein A9995_00635 [Erythrobacter sp. QSSC1-22B]|uniref:hypothetical protein n=1 Tax=Erythrobacter sp. QSSC1-22B TaxID=1860125 RepID=UPI0008054CD0|nr:hypothetical protein [Erythrobacter sp. QSSC1-22B]OBX20273.1 hypothetical protein A9995_00635 [Erythrobacter sp. QSSC1-22B]
MVKESLPAGAEATSGELPLVGRIALAWSRGNVRDVLLPLLLLDDRLARILATVREPMLAQMRLAWWRDRLGEARGLRPEGDPVLDAIGLHWHGEETALVALVDGWEELLGDAPLSETAFQRFAEGKGAAFAAAGRLTGQAGYPAAAHNAGSLYAFGDCLPRLTDLVERERLRAVASRFQPYRSRLPSALRPLAILGGLGDRVLRRGQGPLFGDRGSALLAMRLGILGR